MILKSLYDYALAHKDSLPPKGMEWREIEFIIVINSEGRFVRFESTRRDKKSCAQFMVPKAVGRTSGIRPNLLWDNGRYTLGIEDKDIQCRNQFAARVNEVAKLCPNNRGLQALTKFYCQSSSILLKEFEKDPLFDDVRKNYRSNFSFRLDGEETIIAEDLSIYASLPQEDAKCETTGVSLVTGQPGNLIRTMPPTPIPDNSPMAALVAIQTHSGYDSYGKTQAFNAPMSTTESEVITSALRHLMSKESSNKAQIGDRTILFWTSGNSEVGQKLEKGIKQLMEPFPKEDNKTDLFEVCRQIVNGEINPDPNDRVYVLGLAPNIGRIAVVLWIEEALTQFASYIVQYYQELNIIDNRPTEYRRSYTGLHSMLSNLNQAGKIIDVPPSIIDATVKAVLGGTNYPIQLFTETIKRIKEHLTISPISVQRAALLKAVITRQDINNTLSNKLSIMLDKTYNNIGYLCGRLTAVLEKIQADTKSGDSIRTRHMAQASTSPATAFPTLLSLFTVLGEKLPEGLRVFYMQLFQEIIDKIPSSGFPAHLDLSDQGRFFVGYYHQRADLYTKKEQ